MSSTEKMETLQTFAAFPPEVKAAFVAGKAMADLEHQMGRESRDERKEEDEKSE